MQREELIRKLENNLQELNEEGLDILEKCFSSFVESERYRQDTTPERMAELKAAQAAREAEEEQRKAAREEELSICKIFRYDRNTTMRLLGYQTHDTVLLRYKEQFDDVMKANPFEGTWNICYDMFSLGVICGKHIDRQRRKERAANRGR